jgi:dTDP-glucose 4,6-dehydratase
MANNVCVIGSNSFSGATFCAHLITQGYRVVGISRSDEPAKCFLPYRWQNDSGFEFHRLDLNHHLDQIESLLDELKPRHIYNFAAQSMVAQSWDHPEHWFTTNTVSTIKLHDRLRHKDYLERYIHVSTPEVYGNCEGSVTEDAPYNPSTPYAVSRAAADMSLKTFHEVYQFPVISTRAANVYGEGQQLYRIIPITILKILLGQKLALHGGGISERSFIHMDDVARATLLVAERGRLGSCYHISTQSLISIRGLVERICSFMNVNFEDVCDVAGERKGKDAAYRLDSARLRQELDWQPDVSLDDGIHRTIAWVKRNFETLRELPMHYIHKV